MPMQMRDAHALILRSLGWQEYVAGTTDAMQTSGWLPPGRHQGHDPQVLDIREGAVLPPGTWDTVRAMQRVTVEAFARGELVLEVKPVIIENNDGPREVVRMTVNNPGGDFYAVKDVEFGISPLHFRQLWEGWVEEVMHAAPGRRRTPEEAQRLIDQLIEQHDAGAHDHDHGLDHDDEWPRHPSTIEALSPGVPVGRPTIGETIRGHVHEDPPRADVELSHERLSELVERDRPILDALTGGPPPALAVSQACDDATAALAALSGLRDYVCRIEVEVKEAQRILDEGGKGARKRALEALGFRT